MDDQRIYYRDDKEKFYRWLTGKKALPDILGRRYVSALRKSEQFAQGNISSELALYSDDVTVVKKTACMLLNRSDFRKYNYDENGRLKDAIDYYMEYLGVQEALGLDEKYIASSDKASSDRNNNDNYINSMRRYNVKKTGEKKKEFIYWLHGRGMNPFLAKKIALVIEESGKIAIREHFIAQDIFEVIDERILKDCLKKLLEMENYKNDVELSKKLISAWGDYLVFACGVDLENREMVINRQRENETTRKDESFIYIKLRSLARVYDNLSVFSLEWIRDKLGWLGSIEKLKFILEEFSGVTKVRDEEYSFSKRMSSVLEFDKDAFVRVLMARYQNGMQMDSIDIDIFRETYKEITGKEINLCDDDLEQCLLQCGIVYENRVFPADGIVDSNARERLKGYIKDSFDKGKQVLYYSAIYSDLAEVFSRCYNLSDSKMLKAYLEFIYNSDELYFYDEYMTRESNVRINHAEELENYLREIGKPLSYDEIYAGLSHISKDLLYNEIKINRNIICNEKGHYFLYENFEISRDEEILISELIDDAIKMEGYCIWSLVYERIRNQLPVFIENNAYLSSIGIRNALSKRMSGKYHFDGEVICFRGKSISMGDVFRYYGEYHTPFSDDDIYWFAQKVSKGSIYFDSVSETAARVSKNLFINRKELCFDIEAVDNAISTYLNTGYMLIRDIDSFLVFPNVGYEWNAFLLETFLLYYSRKFTLMNNGRSLNNVAGVVVRRGSGYDKFEDICVDVVANSECELTKNKVLNYLVEINLLTRRSYNKIDSVLVKAKQIRNRKE